MKIIFLQGNSRKSLLKNLLIPALIAMIICPVSAQDGEALFKTNCAVCHTIGKGILVGPDLANVQERREKEWIINFIKSSQSVIKSEDSVAVALFEKFKNVQMPDQNFSDQEFDAILAYIESTSPELMAVSEISAEIPEAIPEPVLIGRSVEEATEEEIVNGRFLFSGVTRLEGRGPACTSCHNVKNDRLLGGGLLAKDLTNVFSRLNESGIKAMLTSPPFPAMKYAYMNRPITDDEAFQITAFLKIADKESVYQHSRDYGSYFLIAGFTGLVFLLIVFTFFWRGRKIRTVNHKIYYRQIKSESYY